MANPTGAVGPLEPDAEQVEAERARTLLELAAAYTRQALEVPDELERLRALMAETLFENAMLRLELRQLGARVERLEKRREAQR
jgi:regulator of replication initiation timing